MHNSGAGVSSIRKAIELRYGSPSGTMTPTPAAPAKPGAR
jgi:hypothetical protein